MELVAPLFLWELLEASTSMTPLSGIFNSSVMVMPSPTGCIRCDTMPSSIMLMRRTRDTHSFRLLSSPPANPDGEEVRIRRTLPRQRRNPESSDENTNTSQSNDESESEPEEGEDQNYTTYTRTDPADWKEIKGRARGRTVEPIPWSGGDEEFSVNITDEELELLKDESGDIRFHKVRSAHYLIVYWYHCY